MSNVLIDKSKIDNLANAISVKSGEPLTLTLDEMVSAVDGIEVGGGSPTLETVTKTYTPSTSAVTDTITPSSGYDGIEEVDVTVSAVPMASFYSETVPLGYSTENNKRVWKIKAQTELDPNEGDTEGWISAGFYGGGTRTFNAIAQNTTITPTTSSQTIGGANYMMEGAVTVSAMPSGSATPASSISCSSATVTTGTNTLTLTKTISNTPQVSAGYISNGTAGNTSVSLTASVNTRSSSDLTASTLTVTAPSGYYASNATKTLTDANLTAGNIKKDVTIFGVTGTLESGGGSSKNVQVVQGTTRTTSSTLTAIGAELTVSKTGTYDIYWSGYRSTTSGSYTYGTQLYVNGVAYGTQNTTWTNHVQNNHLTNVSLTANEKLRVYGRNSRGSSYYIYAPTLVIIEV